VSVVLGPSHQGLMGISPSGIPAGADLGFYKGACPIHLKGAPEVERRRRRGVWDSPLRKIFFVFLISKW